MLDAAYVRRHYGVVPGEYVRLAVTDNGAGMDPETQSRIFEPFFTTKERGKGTGLGLPTVFGIVQRSGGHVRVHSDLGRGTTFKVHMPCTSAPVQLRPSQRIAVPRGGSETILLVEDDDQVRSLASGILSGGGYKVFDARNGAEALQVCEQHPSSIDLLVTDVV